jgi:hypothetical protein
MRKIEPRPGPVDDPDANPRGPLMTPTSALLTPDESLDSREIGPVFVNDTLNAASDMGDWWLDLGHPGDLNMPA